MSIIIQTGSTFVPAHDDDVKVHDTLPVGTYVVKFDKQQGTFYLARADDFTLPKKIYGKADNKASRILDTFESRPLSTGVLMSGIKGAGKTLLAKQVSVMAQERGIATIIINHKWFGDEFNSFIQKIDVPVIVLFDEFEKIYEYYDQQKILTLFDGVFPTKKLFMLTSNTTNNVSEFLRNRPGRIYYNFTFDTLEQKFIEEYCRDCLDNLDHLESILTYTSIFTFFNFDMLVAAVEEMNRYGETLAEVLEVLNILPEGNKNETHTISVIVAGAEYVIDPSYKGFSPNQFRYTLWMDDDMPKSLNNAPPVAKSELTAVTGSDSEFDTEAIIFDSHHITNFNQDKNQFEYTLTKNGATVTLNATRNERVDDWKYNHVR